APLEILHHDENDAENERRADAGEILAAPAATHAAIAEHQRDARQDQNDGVGQGKPHRRNLAVRQPPFVELNREIEIAEQQIGEERALGGDEAPHAPPAETAPRRRPNRQPRQALGIENDVSHWPPPRAPPVRAPATATSAARSA